MTNWFDKDGFLHLEPNPEVDTTINAPLFTGTYICLRYELGILTFNDVGNFLYAISNLYWDETWHTHSKSLVDRFSFDNFTGVICALMCCKKYCEKNGGDTKEIDLWLDRIPHFHHNLDHPRDFIFIGYCKKPWLFWPLLPVLFLILVVACWQTYKIRNDRYIVKTDQKIMCLIRFIAASLPFTEFVCNYIIKRKVHVLKSSGLKFRWINYFYIFNEYYKNKEHPNLELIRQYTDIKA